MNKLEDKNTVYEFSVEYEGDVIFSPDHYERFQKSILTAVDMFDRVEIVCVSSAPPTFEIELTPKTASGRDPWLQTVKYSGGVYSITIDASSWWTVAERALIENMLHIWYDVFVEYAVTLATIEYL